MLVSEFVCLILEFTKRKRVKRQSEEVNRKKKEFEDKENIFKSGMVTSFMHRHPLLTKLYALMLIVIL
jgi:hypothetical protein